MIVSFAIASFVIMFRKINEMSSSEKYSCDIPLLFIIKILLTVLLINNIK